MLTKYIFLALHGTSFLLILLLPAAMGYFFAKNESGLCGRFMWPNKGWLLISSALIFILSQKFFLFSHADWTYTTLLVVDFVNSLLMLDSSCLLQLTALLLVSSRQTYFIQKANMNSISTTSVNVKNLLSEYENISQGIGPLYVLEFCIHAPIILCYAYFMMTESILEAVTNCTNVLCSSLILIHICMISEDSYDAVQNLVPAIR
jgi:hypothetical protein